MNDDTQKATKGSESAVQRLVMPAYTRGEHNGWPCVLNKGEPLEGDDFVEELNLLHGENETLRTEKAALSGALDELLFLKVLKDKSGKTPEYLERQPKAWAAAMQVLDTLEA